MNSNLFHNIANIVMVVLAAATAALLATGCTSLPDGTPFPARDLIIFITFCVIAFTLLGQGLTLAPLIRKLKVGSDWSMAHEHHKVRDAMQAAALATIDELLEKEQVPREWARPLQEEITDRLALSTPEGPALSPQAEWQTRLRLAVIKAERRELIRLWRNNDISDEVMRHQEEILDYQQAQL